MLSENSPLVSVIMPTYNYGQFIAEAIESVLCQTYDNFELIIVDDHSTDNTPEIVQGFLSDKRISYVRLDENKGVSHARNVALERAKGDFIAFIDSDDKWLCNKLMVQINFMSENSDVSITNCGGFAFEKENKILFKYSSSRIIKNLYYDFFSHCPIQNPMLSVVIKRNSINQLNLKFDTNLAFFEDRDFLLYLILKYKYSGINEPLFYVRKHDNQNTKDKTKIMQTARNFKQLVFKHLNDKKSLNHKLKLIIALSENYFSISYRLLNANLRLESIKYHFLALLYNPFEIFKLRYHIQTLKCIIGRKIENKIKQFYVRHSWNS